MAKPVAGMSEDELTDRLRALPPPPVPAPTEEEFAADIARAKDDVAAGRVYSHAIVSEWLRSWDDAGRIPFKEWLAEKRG